MNILCKPATTPGTSTIFPGPSSLLTATIVVAFAVTFSARVTPTVAQQPDLAAVIEGIRENHRRLLHLPGGIAVEYKASVDQPPGIEAFLFPNGFDGHLRILWPQLYIRIEGGTVVDAFTARRRVLPNVREAMHDFDTLTGVSREGKVLAQIANFRHVFTAKHAYLLNIQHYVEASQMYVPGETMTTDYWLPNALEQNDYSIVGEETINGVSCLVVRRKAMDTLWVSPRHAFVICRRDVNYGPKKPLRERTYNKNLRQVSPGVWLPMEQIRERYDPDTGERAYTLTLRVTKYSVGDVEDKDLTVIIPKDTQAIEDHLLGVVHQGKPNTPADFKEVIGQTRMDLDRPGGIRGFLIAINIAIVLAVLIWFVRRRTKTV